MPEKSERIVLGGGCFWCLAAVYKRIEGVVSTRPGYAGGNLSDPSYEQVCTGKTGHAEVVEVSYHPDVVTLETLLEVFWRAHDPTTPNRQGGDVGTQYRSIILYEDDAQRNLAEMSLSGLIASGAYRIEPVTEIVPLDTFWPAEAYHSDYFENNRSQGYCRLVIEPKLHKLSLLED
jgi:peptide-methionine (S)-S-oxide reductase